MGKIYNNKFLSESAIRFAINNSINNSDAAEFLNVSYNTYKKYALMYYDTKEKKNLYDLHKTGLRKNNRSKWNKGKKVNQIITGAFIPKNLNDYKYRDLLIREGFFLDRCNRCGFDDRRRGDYRVPLLLKYRDGDKTNKQLSNVELICLNCNFLLGNNIFGKKTI